MSKSEDGNQEPLNYCPFCGSKKSHWMKQIEPRRKPRIGEFQTALKIRAFTKQYYATNMSTENYIAGIADIIRAGEVKP